MWYNGGMIYNWLIKHKKNAYGVAIGFLIFTILVYAFQSHWLVRHIYKYIDYWAIPLSAAFMLVLAYMAYISIAENRRMRAEDRKVISRGRRVDDVLRWINRVIKLRTESFVPYMGDDNVEITRRGSELYSILENSRWVKIEATRLDMEVKEGEIKLVDKINTLLGILEKIPPIELDNLTTQLQEDILNECTEALEHISAIKAALLI